MLLKAAVFFVVFAKFLVTNQCENVENRIIGGEFCKIETIPYIVKLITIVLNKTSNKANAIRCGGSVLTPSWILTAAHCVSDPSYKILRSFAMMGSEFYQSNTTIVYIDKSIVYPNYDEKTIRHDIALLHLNKSIDEPMTYPVFVKTKLETDHCTKGFIAGWGRVSKNNSQASKALKCANITLGPKKKCKFTKTLELNPVRDGTKVYHVITENKISMYKGDSGGPLTCDGKLIGVASFLHSKGTNISCTVFTKIERYFKFIANYTGLKLPAWEPTDPEYVEGSSDTKTEDASQKHEEKSTSSCSNSFSTPVETIILFSLALISFWGLF